MRVEVDQAALVPVGLGRADAPESLAMLLAGHGHSPILWARAVRKMPLGLSAARLVNRSKVRVS